MSRNSTILAVSIFLVLLLEVGFLQLSGRAYLSGFGASSDEASHFVSAVMLHDFVQQPLFSAPMQFARDYYLHYPKVGIGNWPPFLYLTMGGWFFLFGVSRMAALAFIACTAALTGTAIFLAGRKCLSGSASFFAASIYLALPLVQSYADQIMTEHLVTLLIFLATVEFSRFIEVRTARSSLLFGVVATLAILTRGSAWCLALVPALVILMTHQWKMATDWRLWLSAVPVGVFCVPWYVLTRGMAHGAMVGYNGDPLGFIKTALLSFSVGIVTSIGPVLFILAAVGVVNVVCSGRFTTRWASFAAMLFSVFAFHCVVPASIETRYMMQLLPVVLLFSAAGMDMVILFLSQSLGFSLLLQCHIKDLPVLIAILVVAMVPQPITVRNAGFENVAKQIADYESLGRTPTILVASDSIGEGSLIAAVVARETRPHSIVLRASKLLVHQDWLGREASDQFTGPGELRRFLDDVPVSFVVIDEAIDPPFRRHFHSALLDEMTPDRWHLLGTFDVIRRGKPIPAAVRVFERSGGAQKAVDMQLVGKLMGRK